jgi:ribosome-associated protein YbcJ (S4-like RNA binding protein)
MEAFVIDSIALKQLEKLTGVVVTEEVRANGKRLFRKGHRLSSSDVVALASHPIPVHAVRLAPDEIHEDEAGMRLARAIAARA